MAHSLLLYLVPLHFNGKMREGKAPVVRAFYTETVDALRHIKYREPAPWNSSRERALLEKLEEILEVVNSSPDYPIKIEFQSERVSQSKPVFDLIITRKDASRLSTDAASIRDSPEQSEPAELLISYAPLPDASAMGTDENLAQRSKPPVAMRFPLEVAARRNHQPAASVYVLEEQGLVVGRKHEIKIARDRWLRDRKRPLLIHGPPGIGKSTLALAVLHDSEVEQGFGSRRYRLRCDEFLTVNDMIARIGDKWFGLPHPLTELQVIGKLSEGKCAVLLDNYETLLRGKDSENSQEWLAKLLGVNDLWLIVAVQGHQFPRGVNWADPMEPPTLSPDEARELFCRICRRPSDAEDPRLDRLLDDMAGVPHAIELLAAQARNYGNLEPLVVRWNRERTALLRTGLGKSRAESIDESYSFAISSPFLTEDHRKLLRILAFLPAGIADDDVDKVMDCGLGAAGAICNAGLARSEGSRLRMLEPLRQYVTHSDDEGEQEKLVAVEYFLALAANGTEIGGDRDAIASKLLAEYPNAVRAIRAGLDSRNEMAIEAAMGLSTLSGWTGVGVDARLTLLEEASDLARQSRDTEAEARCKCILGNIARSESRFDSAADRYREACALFEEIDNLGGVAKCVGGFGSIAHDQGKLEEAADLYRRQLALYTDLDDQEGVASTMLVLGDIARGQGNFEEATLLYRGSCEMFTESGGNLGEADCLFGLGEIAGAQDRLDDAAAYYREAREFYRKRDDRRIEGWCILTLCEIAIKQGRIDDPDLYGQALEIFKEIDDKQGVAACIRALGAIASEQDELDEAADLYRQARKLYEEINQREGVAKCIQGLGDVALNQERFGEAADFYEEARQLHKEIDQREGVAECIQGLGHIAFRQEKLDEAAEFYEEARELFKETNKVSVICCITDLAYIAMHQARTDEAADLQRQAREIFKEMDTMLAPAACIARWGGIALDHGRFDAATDLYNEARDIFNELDEKKGEVQCIRVLSELAYGRSDFDDAEDLGRKALDILEPLSKDQPHSYGDQMAWALILLSRVLAARSDSNPESCALAKQALELACDPDVKREAQELLGSFEWNID